VSSSRDRAAGTRASAVLTLVSSWSSCARDNASRDRQIATAITLIAAFGELRLRFDERRFGLRTIELDEYRARGNALAFVESVSP
jgi:hypothetical protein